MGRKKRGGKRRGGKKTTTTTTTAAAAEEAVVLNDRVATGQPPPGHKEHSRDIHFVNFAVSFHGSVLIQDTELKLAYGNRYGLIGANGSGKTTFLRCLGHRDIPIPEHIDLFLLEREVEGDDTTPLEYIVKDVEERVAQLEAYAELLVETEGPDCPEINDVYDKIDEMDASTAEQRAGMILHGLGFTKAMMNKPNRDFSGGWRMRVSLAKALFERPSLLLLDEPTNHLDLEACVWLEEYLANYTGCLVLISHSQDFLNAVCTHIINLRLRQLTYYTGNYDMYVQTRHELEEHQMKRYKREQEQIADMKQYIARFGHGSAKLARQAQSKEKTLAKMVREGLTEKVVHDKVVQIRFPDPGELPPPVLQFNDVSFGYSPGAENLLYSHIDFGIDLDTRLALVGPNGAGKSTLLKLLVGELTPTDGMVQRNSHLRIAWYHQHLADQLQLEKSAVQFMLDLYPDFKGGVDGMRAQVGRFGLTGKSQMCPMLQLSDGQKSRVVFAMLAWRSPHLLVLDEPTNHLDIETIDALADAINNFSGGMVLVSHDFRLINQVAQEIWIAENQTLTKWNDDIASYKEHLRNKVLEEQEAFAAN